MDRVLCELCDSFAFFTVKDLDRKVRKFCRKVRRENLIWPAELVSMFYNARAYEIEENCKAASHAGRRLGLSPLLWRAYIHAVAAHSASGGSRSRLDWHPLRRRNDLSSGCALRSAEYTRAIGDDSSLESGVEGKSV